MTAAGKRAASAGAVLALAFGHVGAQAPLFSRAELAPLERAALEVARAGKGEVWHELVALMTKLGLPAKDLAAHDKAGRRHLERARNGAAATRAGKLLHQAADKLQQGLEARDEVPRRLVAELLLELDSGLEVAHRILGHEQFAGTFHPPGEARRAEHRREIATALAAARQLGLPIETGVSDDALLLARLGRPGAFARCGKIELHSAYSPTKTERMLRQTLRAAAFVNFLATGKLEVPDYGAQKSVLFRSREHYLAAVAELRDRRAIEAQQADIATRPGMFSWRFTELKPQLQLCALLMEAEAEAMWLTTLEYWRHPYPCLNAGRIDYVCRTMLGKPMPRMAELQQKAAPARGGTSASDPSEAATRQSLLTLAPAGIHGSKLWLRYLARRGEAPPWSATMHDQLATIQGDELLKATLMVAFLAEDGLLRGLDDRATASGEKLQASALAAGVGEDLGSLDRRWQEWLLGPGTGLVQRLEATAIKAAPAAVDAVAILQALRLRVGLSEPIEHDAELGAGCQAHAEYLAANPDQQASWPECHEEFADRPQWSAAGAIAGQASVIVAGVKGEAQAIDGWMATFYHRLPLLDPGLRRIGYGREHGIAVLDCGSMVDPRQDLRDSVIVWPFDGMTDTPLRFAPEMPAPVPDQDQSQWGYPITMQCSQRSSGKSLDVRMVLRTGNENGDEVPCWFSTPEQPTNPLLAPANAFCLIPKSPLRRATTYCVTAEFVAEGAKLTWHFKT
ncbi:MAG: hypothetical protein KDC98_12120 [Planctomycetes bacterium]|nr:hypothetical protein [Planctomycetota bacterium]